MKIVATIEARMGSSRLPGKILAPICGKPVLELMIERVRRSQLIHDVVVATTDGPKDDVVEELCRKIGCSYFRGSEPDILDRLRQTAKSHAIDLIVQTTGDCPLIDPRVIDEGIRTYLNARVDYVSNRLTRTWPCGLDVQVYRASVLDRVAQETQDPVDREHGSYYIYTHPKKFTMKNYASSQIHAPAKRWTLDYPEDLELIRKIFEALYPKNPAFDVFDILRFLEENPELEKINSQYPIDVTPYEHYESL